MKHKIVLIFIGLIVFSGLFFFLKGKYNQYIWRKSMVTLEHRLQVGSFIFCKKLESNGSQWYSTRYYINECF
jgi:hypothetical protein